MNVLKTLAALGAAAALTTACGGGGGTTAPAVATTSSGSGSQTGLLAVQFTYGGVAVTAQSKGRAAASATRRPRFITPGLQSLAVYDGATLIYVANVDLAAQQQFTTVYANPAATVSPGSCTNNATTEVCTLSIRAVTGQHAFDLIAYPLPQTAGTNGGPPARFTGIISSEGEVSANLQSNTNAAATLTMLGVASYALLSGPDEAPNGTPVQFTYEIWDSTPLQIVLPGAFDNGPVTISAVPNGIATVSPQTSLASPAPSPGPQSFTVTCTNPNGGTVTVLLQAGTHPSTAYASNLTYTPANYSSGTLGSATLSCDAVPANYPITVQ
jgi:hypothetical protein